MLTQTYSIERQLAGSWELTVKGIRGSACQVVLQLQTNQLGFKWLWRKYLGPKCFTNSNPGANASAIKLLRPFLMIKDVLIF